MDVADLLARGAVALAGGLLGALDQPGVGGEVLDAGEAVDVVDLVEDDEGEDLADAVDGAQEMEGVGIVVLGALRRMKRSRLRDQPVEMVDRARGRPRCSCGRRDRRTARRHRPGATL